MNQFVIATAVLMGGAVVTPGGSQSATPTSKAAPTRAMPSSSAKPADGARFLAHPGAPAKAAAPRPGAFDPSICSNERSIALGGKWHPAPSNGSGHNLGCGCTPDEGEPDCGIPVDTVNGGCNSSPEVYSSISLGGSVCGSGAFDGSFRDTDWYRFSLASTTTVVLTVNAQFPVQTLIIQDHTCPFPTVLTNVSGPACTDVVTSTTLSAGDYVAFVGYDFFSSSDILTCGVANTYHASLSEGEPPVGCTLDSGVSDNSIGLGNFGGGETLYLHRFGGGGQAQVNSISMAWGTPSFPGASVPNGSPATIRIFSDPNNDGIPDDAVQVATKDFLTAGADTDVFQTVAFDSPVQMNGVYFVGVSLFSGPNQFPLGADFTVPSANRAWLVADSNQNRGTIDYTNLTNNQIFSENASLGIDCVYMLRADCESPTVGCSLDNGAAETEWGYGDPGEKLYLHRAGNVGELAEINSISMSWGSAALPGFSVPNGTPAVVRVFEDPNDDGIPDDLVLLASAPLVTQDVDTDIFNATAFSPPVAVQGVYFYAVSIVVNDFGRYPLGFDTDTPSANRAWYAEQSGGNLDYNNLPGSTIFGETSVLFPDGVFMLRADCQTRDEITAFCAPGVGGVVTCPCGNPQVPADSLKGCNNFAGGGSGGAILAGTGPAKLSGDALAMDVSGGVNVSVTVLFQGTSGKKNARSGAGVACVEGNVIRLYSGDQVAGAIAFPNNGVSFHDQSSAKGFPITAPQTLYYYAAYRNAAANGSPGCPGFTFGFNTTNALAVIWTP